MQKPSELTDEPGEVIEEESLIEEVSIDGMCGVY
jgi:mycofactocin precursor